MAETSLSVHVYYRQRQPVRFSNYAKIAQKLQAW